MIKKSASDFRVGYNPYIYFLIFTAANILLTYFPFSLTAKTWILFLGLVLPFFFWTATRSAIPTNKAATGDIPKSGRPFFLMAGILVIVVGGSRFSDFFTGVHWPSGDESLTGIAALELLREWHWNLFYSFGQVPTTAVNACFLFLKISNSPFFSLYFPMALVSSLTVFTGYAAIRQFFPRSFSLLAAFLLAVNDWSVSVGHNFMPGSFFPFGNFGFYFPWLFFKFHRAEIKKNLGLRSWFSSGLGYFTFTSWPIVLALVIFIAVKHFFSTCSQEPSLPWLFSIFLGLSLLPLAAAVQEGNFGQHLRSVSIFKSDFSFGNQTRTAMDYINQIFWDGSGDQLVPVKGGFLNIFSSSLFFLGVIELFRFPGNPVYRSLLFSFPLFLAPGFLSLGVEDYRILPVLPVLIIVASLGLQSLTALFPTPQGRTPLLALLLLVVLFVDFTRLTAFQKSPPARSEIQQFYDALRERSAQEGPGLILTELIPETYDFSLTYTTYPFNGFWLPESLKNHPISSENFKWIGVFTDANYVPFLASRFPRSRWIVPVTNRPYRYRLGLIPVTPEILSTLDQWKKFYTVFQGINLQIMNTPDKKSRREVLQNLIGFYPDVPEDPYLQSCYFEKLLFNYSWEKTFHPEDQGADWLHFSPFLRRSFGKSYQNANLCEKYGRLLATEGRTAEARKIFRRALKFYPGNEWLLSQIRQLDPPP